jgi:hypothetical protein
VARQRRDALHLSQRAAFEQQCISELIALAARHAWPGGLHPIAVGPSGTAADVTALASGNNTASNLSRYGKAALRAKGK